MNARESSSYYAATVSVTPSGVCAAAAALSKKMITFSKSLLCVARYYMKEVKNLSLNLTAAAK